MKMIDLGQKPSEPMSMGGHTYYDKINVKASDFPEIQKMKDGEECHVTVRLVKVGSRLRDDRSDTDITMELHSMGYEDNDEDDGFTDKIGYTHHAAYRRQ